VVTVTDGVKMTEAGSKGLVLEFLVVRTIFRCASPISDDRLNSVHSALSVVSVVSMVSLKAEYGFVQVQLIQYSRGGV
jgi:hypothetical protein